MPTATRRSETAHLVLAGVMAAIVGYASTFAVVLAGLRAVGATPAQAASGLLALCVAQAATILLLARRTRLPVLTAWSTPGAALLASTGAVAGGWPAAVGAFMACGALIALTGLWPGLGRLIAAIPVSIAQAMLAGILLPLCLAPLRSLASTPLLVLPVIATWLVGLRWYPRWAVPAAFVITLAVVGIEVLASAGTGAGNLHLVPVVAFTMPAWTWQALAGIALPLFIVTMASQNVPGAAVLESFGFRAPWRAAMAATGLATAAAAPAGAHAVNLAAITAAMVASPEAGRDPSRRWIAAWSAGWAYLSLGLASAALTTVVLLAPEGLVETAAGLALLMTLAASLRAALDGDDRREPAIVTFAVAAAGIGFLGIGAAFWALIAGLAVRGVVRQWNTRVGQAGG